MTGQCLTAQVQGGSHKKYHHRHNIILRGGILNWLRFAYDVEIASAE
jgi:hypothetical protein